MTYVKRACKYCGGHIELPIQLKDEKVQCPHCERTGNMQPLKSPKDTSVPELTFGLIALIIILAAISFGPAIFGSRAHAIESYLQTTSTRDFDKEMDSFYGTLYEVKRPFLDRFKSGSGRSMVYEAACELARDGLKAPLTAQFGPIEKSQVAYYRGAIQVQGVVDAQNAFGAMMRSRWTLVMEHAGGTTFRAINLTIQGDNQDFTAR